MAGARAIELGRRLREARGQLDRAMVAIASRPGGDGAIWQAIRALECAAIAVGEERERNRRVRGGMSGADADPAQKMCSQCGKPFTASPCGPTHAAVKAYRQAKRSKT